MAKISKRKTSPDTSSDFASNKVARKEESSARVVSSNSDTLNGIVQRKYYPQEISNARCALYCQGKIPRPGEQLDSVISETQDARNKIAVGDSVIHWFKRDLRLHDNKALRQASEKARSKGVPLIALFLISPQDYEAHRTSPARIDFELRTLAIMREDLKDLNIPLVIETVEKRDDVPQTVLELCDRWGAKHVFCGIEYEVDELRREKRLVNECLRQDIAFNPIHDDVVIPPGEISTGQGKQYSVYSPWYRAWVAHIHKNPKFLELSNAPLQNDTNKLKTFENIKGAVRSTDIPHAPAFKKLASDEERTRLAKLWPAGEHEAQRRLEKFAADRIKKYKDERNLPAANSTAMLSVHFAVGTLSARQAIVMAQQTNSSKKLDAGNPGIISWISEVAWRDFYKHVMVHWPYVCMNKPFKYQYSAIEWEYSDEHFKAWCDGRTGFPIVDAAMRQLKYMKYVHNRCRMIVASFLCKDLMLDWRMGERYFMESLIDADFASNNGGWGFSSSTGVDPQPYFRIFNPELQSEKFDPDGEYIRKWVPELSTIKGKAIHAPYARGAADAAAKADYPRPIVNHSEARKRALERYKAI